MPCKYIDEGEECKNCSPHSQSQHEMVLAVSFTIHLLYWTQEKEFWNPVNNKIGRSHSQSVLTMSMSRCMCCTVVTDTSPTAYVNPLWWLFTCKLCPSIGPTGISWQKCNHTITKVISTYPSIYVARDQKLLSVTGTRSKNCIMYKPYALLHCQ